MLKTSTVLLTLFAVSLIGLHLRLSLMSGSHVIMPMYLMVIPAMFFTLYFWQDYLTGLSIPLLFLATFLLFQPHLSSAPGSSGSELLLSGVSFLVSIISMVSTFFLLTRVNQRGLRRLVLIAWSLLVVVAICETTFLRPLVDSVRDTLYAGSGRAVYLSVERDVHIYGRIRPTAFASEPSFLATTLALLSFLYLALQPRPRSFGALKTYGALFSISFLVSPSLQMGFYLLATVAWLAWPSSRRLAMLYTLFAGFAILTLFLPPTQQLILQTFSDHSNSGSFFGRIIAGPRMAWLVLGQYPAFGLGLGNVDGAWPFVSEVWSESSAWSKFPWFQGREADDLVSSGFWWQWFYFGILGELIFLGLLVWLLRSAGVENPLRSILLTWIVWYGGASGVDAGSWFVMALYSLSAVAKQPDHANMARKTRHMGVPQAGTGRELPDAQPNQGTARNLA